MEHHPIVQNLELGSVSPSTSFPPLTYTQSGVGCVRIGARSLGQEDKFDAVESKQGLTTLFELQASCGTVSVLTTIQATSDPHG